MAEKHLEMFNIRSHPGNANQNYSKSSPYTIKIAKNKKTSGSSFWGGCDIGEPSSTAGGTVNVHKHYGSSGRWA